MVLLESEDNVDQAASKHLNKLYLNHDQDLLALFGQLKKAWWLLPQHVDVDDWSYLSTSIYQDPAKSKKVQAVVTKILPWSFLQKSIAYDLF